MSDAEITRVAIDGDPGRDDALAILAALGCPWLQVDLISTVAGNVTGDRAVSNTLAVLAAAGVDDVPVNRGSAAPLRRDLVQGSTLHGDMATSDPRLPAPLAAEAGDAHGPLMEWCRTRAPEPKHLVAIGPLTNIARVLLEDDGRLAGVDALYVMGGTVGHMATRVSPTAEFNAHTDPEAANLVLSSGLPVHLYDYDATTACQIPVDRLDGLADRVGGSLGIYVEGWLRHLWTYANRVYGREGIAVHDLYALAGAAGYQPERWDWYRMSVDASDERRGTIHSEPAPEGDGVAVARGIDPDEMFDFLIESTVRLARPTGEPV